MALVKVWTFDSNINAHIQEDVLKLSLIVVDSCVVTTTHISRNLSLVSFNMRAFYAKHLNMEFLMTNKMRLFSSIELLIWLYSWQTPFCNIWEWFLPFILNMILKTNLPVFAFWFNYLWISMNMKRSVCDAMKNCTEGFEMWSLSAFGAKWNKMTIKELIWRFDLISVPTCCYSVL